MGEFLRARRQKKMRKKYLLSKIQYINDIALDDPDCLDFLHAIIRDLFVEFFGPDISSKTLSELVTEQSLD